MLFSRSSKTIAFDFSLNYVVLKRVNVIRDLGVLLDSTLLYRDHIDSIVYRTNKVLGMICAMAKDIRDPLCLKALYCSLVRPILEYASVVWSPINAASFLRVERVQRNFTRIAVRQFLGRTHTPVPPYPVRCRLLDLQSLRDRRSIAQALIVSGLLRNDIDSPMLRSEIPIYAFSCGLRQRDFYSFSPDERVYGASDLLLQCFLTFNNVSSSFDFHIPHQSLRQLFIQSFNSFLPSPP